MAVCQFSFAMEESLVKVAFVEVSCLEALLSRTVSQIICPIADIFNSFGVLINSSAVHFSFFEIPFEFVTIG